MIEALKDSWDDLSEAIKNMSPADQESLRDHFNKFDDDNDDLGDVLFGSYEDFESRMTMLDTETQNSYTNELKTQEVIDMWAIMHQKVKSLGLTHNESSEHVANWRSEIFQQIVASENC